MLRLLGIGLAACLLLACGDDDHDDADEIGVGAQCSADGDCEQPRCEDGGTCHELVCLTRFAGGYCGLEGCDDDDDCPLGSGCVLHDDGVRYCFRLCVDKPDCNANRDVDVEANCVGSIDFVDPGASGKACEPPSSGL